MEKWFVTVGIQSKLTESEVSSLIQKYLQYDWGDTCEEDQEMNKQALETKDRIVAKYTIRESDIFIITDYGHERTTMMLVEEY